MLYIYILYYTGGSTITCFDIDASDRFAGFELLIKANYADHSVLSDAVRLENCKYTINQAPLMISYPKGYFKMCGHQTHGI